jgi:hypothetical protein
VANEQNLRPFTTETAKIAGANGGHKRAEVVPPERRVEISTMGAWVREARRAGWNPYTRNPGDLQRVEERIAKLVALEAKAWSDQDWNRVAQLIMYQLQWERLRLWVAGNQGKNAPMAVAFRDPDDENEARRLMEAKKRREKALKDETVIDGEAKD